MPNLTEVSNFDSGVYQLEIPDPVQGGVSGKSNVPLQNLANRTRWLKDQVDSLKTGAGLDNNAISTAKVADNSITRAKIGTDVIPSAIRNVVLSGPVDASGLPTAVSKITDSTYRINGATKNIIISFAAGYDAKGQVDYIGVVSSDTTVTVNDDAGSPGYNEYIFAERNSSTGVITFGRTIHAPVYGYVAPTSPSSGQLWLDLSDVTMKRWSGSAWQTVQVVVIGEFFHVDFTVSSVTCYEYRSPIEVFSSVPAGTVIQSASQVTPTGYLKCDGSQVNRTTYARLFRAIGTTFGVGNGSTTFNLPDLRGEFIRGFDDGKGTDTHTFTVTGSITNGSATVSASDTSQLAVGMSLSGTGIPAGAKVASITNSTTFVMTFNATATNATASITASGRQFGSYQADLFKSHSHLNQSVSAPVTRQDTLSAGSGIFVGGGSSVQTTSTGGTETRPRNRALAMYIKF